MEYKRLKDIDLQENINRRVFIKFMARDVDVRTQKDGMTKYLTLSLCDLDVKVDAKKFGATDDEISLMKKGAIYRGAIDVKEYAKSPTGYSCIIYNFEAIDENPSSYVEWTSGMEHAQSIIQSALTDIGESIYKSLIYNIIMENWDRFSIWTAASSFHHNQLGGLLVHTAEVIEQADKIAEFWESKYGPGFINRPLVLSAALLHDIAKTQELSVDALNGTTEYSTQASLETHITMCVSMIDVQAYKQSFGRQVYNVNELDADDKVGLKSDEQIKSEQEALSLLKHCILAHHGKLEYGSPISMNCPEANIVHMADELSAVMYRYNRAFSNMESGKSSTQWIGGQPITTYKDLSKS